MHRLWILFLDQGVQNLHLRVKPLAHVIVNGDGLGPPIPFIGIVTENLGPLLQDRLPLLHSNIIFDDGCRYRLDDLVRKLALIVLAIPLPDHG